MSGNLGFQQALDTIAKMSKTDLRVALETLVKDEAVPYESIMGAIAAGYTARKGDQS